MAVEYADSLPALAARSPDLADRVAGFRTVEHVLDWMQRTGQDLRRLDMVTQDEYSHDLIVPHGGLWLSFAMS